MEECIKNENPHYNEKEAPFGTSIYLVAGAIKVYSWKNETRTILGFREELENFLKQNKTFSVRAMENLWAISKVKDSRKLAYYYISKLLKKGVIRKTSKYEKQGTGAKPLVIYV